MNEKDISIQCIIFRVDFETHFNFIDKRGYTAQRMKNTELFDEIQFSTDGFSIKCIKKETPYSNINYSPNTVNGRFEGPFLDIEQIKKILNIINNIYNEFKIPTIDIKRIGARFFFLQDETDDISTNQNHLNFVLNKFISAIKDDTVKDSDFFDQALNIKYLKNDFKCRVLLNPLPKDNYRLVFEKPLLIDLKNSSLIDFDFYKEEYNYNNLNLFKFIQEAYSEAYRVSKSIFSKLENQYDE